MLALFIREIRTRFGGSRLGYFWAIAEPAGQAALFALMFYLIGRESIADVPIPVFMITGLLTFKLFTKQLTQLANAIQANKGLMTYRQVEPIDPLVTRSLIEVLTYFIVLVTLMGLMGWFMGYRVFPVDPL
ncbi:MAG: ABC transporter permease, partial [Oceanobacter sp.]